MRTHMALWLIRAGTHGEHLTTFRDDSRVYLTWDGPNQDLSQVASNADLTTLLSEIYPDQRQCEACKPHGPDLAFRSRDLHLRLGHCPGQDHPGDQHRGSHGRLHVRARRP